jgi:hypothetical protein
MKIFTVLMLLLNFGFCQAQQKLFDSEKLNAPIKSLEVADDIQKQLKNTPTKVEVINTCSTKPELCGTMAFGSKSLVKILEGKYRNQFIYVATTCTETKYNVGQNYDMTIGHFPDFGVMLCDGQLYNSEWNRKIAEKEYYVFFGKLDKLNLR